MSRLTFLPVALMLSCLFFFSQSPYSIGMLFLCLLVFTSLVVGSLESILGLVVFIIYVGGAMILFTYCFMLTPLQEGGMQVPKYPVPLLFLLTLSPFFLLNHLFDFYWLLSLLVLVGTLLFIVMVSVVEVIDLGRGSLRVV